MADLKPLPCPFCGADRIAMHEAQLTQEHHCWCISCEASGPEADTYDGAIMAWNGRKEVPVADHKTKRARNDVLAVLRDIAAGGYESYDGRPIPAEFGADAIRILAREWGIKIKKVPRG